MASEPLSTPKRIALLNQTPSANPAAAQPVRQAQPQQQQHKISGPARQTRKLPGQNKKPHYLVSHETDLGAVPKSLPRSLYTIKNHQRPLV